MFIKTKKDVSDPATSFMVFTNIPGQCQFLIVVVHFLDQTGFCPSLDINVHTCKEDGLGVA